jgi:hypothetical protein
MQTDQLDRSASWLEEKRDPSESLSEGKTDRWELWSADRLDPSGS